MATPSKASVHAKQMADQVEKLRTQVAINERALAISRAELAVAEGFLQMVGAPVTTKRAPRKKKNEDEPARLDLAGNERLAADGR